MLLHKKCDYSEQFLKSVPNDVYFILTKGGSALKKFTTLDDKAVGDILKIYRKSNHITQQKVAEYLGVSRSAYAKYETMRIPNIDVLIKLAALYNTSLDDFFRPFFSTEIMKTSVANAPTSQNQRVTQKEMKLLELYRGSIRKNEILKAAEDIFNADIEIINDVQE